MNIIIPITKSISKKGLLLIFFIMFSTRVFSLDTLKIYIVGVSVFNKFYIEKDGKLKKIKVGSNIKSLKVYLTDSQEINNVKFYYKYGLFGKKKTIDIPNNRMKYLHFLFTIQGESRQKKCFAKWSDGVILKQ